MGFSGNPAIWQLKVCFALTKKAHLPIFSFPSARKGTDAMNGKPQWMVYRLLLAAFIVALNSGLASGESLITPRGMVQDLKQRELQAPPQITARLQKLRQNIALKKWTFQVGYTAALDFEIERITGLNAPANLLQVARQQNLRALEILKKYPPPRRTRCPASASSFDWRTVSGATSVRDQGPCGSCWAFASHGALEGSYRGVDRLLLNTAEQDTLDCNPWGYSCAGGWWAFSYLTDKGTATEADYPYAAVKGTCRTSMPRPYRAVNWGYVDDSAVVPSVAKLKNALCQNGPLAVAVRVTPAFQAYTGGVFNEKAAGSVNHGVTLIGWNDDKKAWLTKNSWGTGWGETCGFGAERGYMWISYDSNSIGYAAAWTRAVPKEDCRRFNPAKASVSNVDSSWKIVDRRRQVLDFGDDKAVADKALSIIQYYKMNRACSVGRPAPSFTYMLVSSLAPAEAMAGEDCIRFDPGTIAVKEIGGHWKIMDGSRSLYDFKTGKEDAHEAFSVIRKYGFTHQCFVGRSSPYFHYLRK